MLAITRPSCPFHPALTPRMGKVIGQVEHFCWPGILTNTVSLMLFLTSWFVLFAGIIFPCYWLVRQALARKLLLLVFCLAFHTHFAGPAGVVPIIILGVATYFAGLSRKRPLCFVSICLCVASLVFYKYTKFLCLQVLGLLAGSAGAAALEQIQPWMPLAPPLAISFFVFEFVHYLYDVSQGKEPIRSPLDFGLFAVFWPSIVAGPVKRYDQFLPALQQGVERVGKHNIAFGLVLVAVGLVKKFAADNLTAYVGWSEKVFDQLDPGERWLVVLAIGLRILWDFSGYSDMAIGFALMFGIRLPINFNWPYLAASIVDFWHRWHISLSTWIRDYIYIPLGGSRHGLLRKVGNGLFAFAICGLWHGAGWNFLGWGLYHGIGLAICSSYRQLGGGIGQKLARVFGHPVVARPATLLFVFVGWLFFFYPIPVAGHMLRLLVSAW